MRARAYWTVAPGRGELRVEELSNPGHGEALVRATASGVSRGSELLVHRGGVPASVADQMRAPFQVGDLAGGGPVKYGYLSVGVVEDGEPDWVGRRVFCLHPHQDRYVVPVSALSPLPDEVPDHRAVLLGTLETAVNALWDGRPLYGDRVAVVGAGMVGASVAALLAQLPLERLELVDPDPERAALGERLGARGVAPEGATPGCDVVFHCSASPEGLQASLDLLGPEGEVVELSWYGDRAVPVELGSAFHARRLRIRASQVSTVSPHRAPRRDHAGRMAVALRAAHDDRLDALLAGPTPFAELPDLLPRLADGAPGLCHVVTYDD
ncbi:zinc-binding alcohol dehydrogenase [Ornithinimicrobium humiphilum]|uniref:Threonine dehydrogenase-like Zn-dependent dehydrogenase n=1 Tax=Ornithinimicrobium humiphilum TaxID=125288 RepID=A0A543KJQ0_9MICO|nr:zinc-binding alcohol dehydrogenase [Ornithinimicrobium humiphilum]TQM95309.1 threonine dehydrogenase-like Zn-dependent dehydrogenase [Ornithinimicrobium humiphilum]